MPPVLRLQDVSYSYRLDGTTVPVLHAINLSVNDGEMVAIQGPSGSGKSTLLYLMGCLLKLQTGKLFIDGCEASLLSGFELAHFRNQKIGFVFQQFHLLARANVLENILLPTTYPSEAPPSATQKQALSARAKDLAKRLGLSDRLEHLPNQLSGGQQQRVAIARALIQDPKIIFADEPTGNLDSKSAHEILTLLKELNAEGKTIVVITHDAEVASHCDRTELIRDGSVTNPQKITPHAHDQDTRDPAKPVENRFALGGFLSLIKNVIPLARTNLFRNRMRTFLTMSGIVIGVAAVLSMVTIGQFTKRTILESYADLGVNTIAFYGYPNWDLKATDIVPAMFRSFDVETDFPAVRTVFPEIQRLSPIMQSWDPKISFAGKTIDTDTQIYGVNEESFGMSNKKFLMGSSFTEYHVRNKSGVCVIGFDIAQRLLRDTQPIGQVIHISNNNSAFGCKVIGVLQASSSHNEWLKPNLHVYLPYTYFQAISSNWWSQRIHNIMIQLRPGTDVENTGKSIKAYFELKYGKSGRFNVNSDSLLLAQMDKFLTLFTILLGVIASVSLGVGAIGITNMMLVSVSERFREIGLRKALGATDQSVRAQFLSEAVLISLIAGISGIIAGFGAYEGLLYAVSKATQKAQFEWFVDWTALTVSLIAIIAVGVASGFFPALRAEKLQIIEALRSE